MAESSDAAAIVAVPYGTASVSSLALSEAQKAAGGGGRPGAPVAFFRPSASRPLRICDLVHPFTRPPQATDLSHADRQLDFMTAHAVGLCGVWNKRLAAIVQGYFRFVRDEVARRSAELAERAGDLSGLVEPDHWAFLAPMPLPRAHLPPLERRSAPKDGEFVAADLAFWTGTGFLAVFAGGGTEFGAGLRARRALDERGVATLRMGSEPAQLALALREADPVFTGFTETEALPASPFRGHGVPRPA